MLKVIVSVRVQCISLANFYYDGCEADYKNKYGVDYPTQLVSTIGAGDAVYVDLDKMARLMRMIRLVATDIRMILSI